VKQVLAHPAWLAAFVLLLASTAPAFARADPLAAPDVDALVKKLTAESPKDALSACFGLDAMLRAGDKGADDAAAKVLALKEQVVKDKDVLALFNNDLAKKPITAARLLVFIVRSQSFVTQNKKGGVVVGQLTAEDGKADLEDVMAQMPIFPDGWFATDVGGFDRALSFRTPGYAPLDVPLSGKGGSLVYVGKCVLKPLQKEDAASLKGTVVLDGSKTPEGATVTLSMSVPPPNTATGGYSPRSHWPKGAVVPVSKTGEFTVSGLSPAAYYLSITADGHVPVNKMLTLKPAEEQDVGEVRLHATDIGVYIGNAAPKVEKLTWEKDYTAALARADKEKKPILIMETATWCGWCKKLEADTLDDPWVCYALSDYVLVKAFEDKEVEGKYGCGGYPTLVYTDSAGKMVHKSVGYMTVLPFLEQIARADQKGGRTLPAELQTLADKKIITLDAGAPALARTTQEPEKKDEELKWAKGVAEDFLAAMCKGDEGQTQLLMDKQMVGVVQGDINWFNHFTATGATRDGSATIAEEALSPDKDEVVFRGRLDGNNANGPVQSKFTIRLAKDKESGKWRVSFFTYSDPVPVEKKP
jgi:thioredoxin family protein